MNTEFRIHVITTPEQDKEIEELNDSFDLHPTDDTAEVYRRVLLQYFTENLSKFQVTYLEVGAFGSDQQYPFNLDN